MTTPSPQVHPTALIEEGVRIGPGTSIWDHVHVRRGASIGSRCIIGEKTYIAYDVRIGDLVKVNAGAYLCAGVTVEDGAMISAHVVFTNDRLPRATDPDLQEPLSSEPGEATLSTTVRRGATIGVNSTIGPGLELGEFCMVGMGSVVVSDVPAHGLAFGNPAHLRGLVCRCGAVVMRMAADQREPDVGVFPCECGREIHWPS